LRDRYLVSGILSGADLSIGAVVSLVLTLPVSYFVLRAYYELDEARAQLAHLWVTDDLTHLYNRRYFIGRADYALSLPKLYGQVFSMLLIDLDDFKQINDAYGHPAGDQMLRMVADTCLQESREVDVLARVGGDEFGLLIPGLQQSQAVQFADRLHQILAERRVMYRGEQLQLTVSVGIVTWMPEITELDRLIYLMDKALYEAKSGGKDKIVVSEAGKTQAE
ncbi:MAG: GGDEF domain-containing protein, partial [Anaerolineaceae bacterium]|nr:GGDEF domain-containing protein [Anaerolineaceae bacterium]